jgi:hypothetical protein
VEHLGEFLSVQISEANERDFSIFENALVRFSQSLL